MSSTSLHVIYFSALSGRISSQLPWKFDITNKQSYYTGYRITDFPLGASISSKVGTSLAAAFFFL